MELNFNNKEDVNVNTSCNKHYQKAKDVTVSYAEKINVTKLKKANLQWIFDTIKSDEAKSIIEKIRAEDDPDKKSDLKKALPYFNIGVFEGDKRSNSNFRSTSFMIFDFDHIGTDLLEKKKRLSENEHVYAVFISPGGEGLKVLCGLEPIIYNSELFSKLYKFYAEKLGAQLGTSADKTSDSARACFFSYDAKIFINEFAIPLSSQLDKIDCSLTPAKEKLTREELLEVFKGTAEGNRHNSLVSVVGTLINKKFDREFIKEFLLRWNLGNKPPLSQLEVLQTVNSVCDSYYKEDILEGYYSQGKEIYEIGFVKDKFFIEKLGKDKFNILVLDKYLKKVNVSENDNPPEENERLVQTSYTRLVVEKHIRHLSRVDYVTDPDIKENKCDVLLDEGVIRVKYSVVPVKERDNKFVEDYLGKTFGEYKDFIKKYLAVYCYTNYQKLPTMIFYGERGSGKSTFAEVLMGICPQISTHWSGNEEGFTYESEKKLLLVEENNTDKASQYKTLKKYTGQKHSTVHKKFKDPYMVMNNMNIVICSNEPIPMYVKKEELPTDEANNQFFVFEFNMFEGTLDNMIQQQLLDRLGHYIQTELKSVFNSLEISKFRYSIPVPITNEERDLFNSNTTELDFDTDLVIQDLARKMNQTSPFKHKGFIQAKLLPVSFITQWNSDITRTHRNSIIKQLKRRRLISADPPVKKQIGGTREFSYIMTTEFLNLITAP